MRVVVQCITGRISAESRTSLRDSGMLNPGEGGMLNPTTYVRGMLCELGKALQRGPTFQRCCVMKNPSAPLGGT